jgi:hypothetical protein
MNSTELRRRMLDALAQTTAGNLAVDDLIPEARRLSAYLPDGAALEIRNARLDTDAAMPKVLGNATLLGSEVTVELTGGGNADHTWLRLTASGFDTDWTLSRGIKNIPQYWARKPDEFGLEKADSFLEKLPIAGPRIIIATDEDKSIGVSPGLNLFGSVRFDKTFADGLLANALSWVDGDTPLTLGGTICIHRDSSPAVVDLSAPLGVLPKFKMCSFQSGEAFLRMRTQNANDPSSASSIMEIAVPIKFGNPKPIDLIVSTELISGGGEFIFSATCEDGSFSLGNTITDVEAALGIKAGGFSLPSVLPALSELYLREVALGFTLEDGSGSPAATALSITLALPTGRAWSPICGVSLTGLELEGVVDFADSASWSGCIATQARIGTERPVVIDLRAQFPECIFSGELDPASAPICLTDALSSFIDVSSLPRIDIESLSVLFNASSHDFSMGGYLVSDWGFPLGKMRFTIEGIGAAVNFNTENRKFTGQLWGTAGLAGATFDVQLAVPSADFAISGQIPALSLKALIDTLCQSSIDLGAEFDFQLENSEIAITKSQDDYVLLLRTTLAKYGTLFFELQRDGSQWGAAIGVDLALARQEDVPGLGLLDSLGIRLKHMMLLLSSVKLSQGFVFNDPAKAGSSDKSESALALPSSLDPPGPGLNVLGQIAFGNPQATSCDRLRKFYDHFKIRQFEIAVALQLLRNGQSITARLDAAFLLKMLALEIQAKLGIYYSGDVIDLNISGELSMQAPHALEGDRLTFDARLDIEENGVMISGSMTGTWLDAFGIQGLKVVEAGLALGCDWEGVPAIGFAGAFSMGDFDGSLGCVLDTRNPHQSALFGSINRLSLYDVWELFASAGGQPGSATLEALRQIYIAGIPAFNLAVDIDLSKEATGKLDRLADAFKKKDTPLGRDPQKTFIVANGKADRWFLTDLANGQAHYEIVRSGDGLQVNREAQLYFVGEATCIGNIPLPQGFRVSGGISIFGIEGSTNVVIESGKGISIDTRMSEWSLAGFINLARGNGDSHPTFPGNGPYLSMSTFRRDGKDPHFDLSCDLIVLGMTLVDVTIHVRSDGLEVHVTKPFLLIEVTLDGTFSGGISPKVDLHGKLVYGFDHGITLLSGLGHLNVNANVTGELSISYHNKVIATLKASATCPPFGKLDLGTLQLSSDGLANVAAVLETMLTNAISNLMKLNPTHWLFAIGKSVLHLPGLRSSNSVLMATPGSMKVDVQPARPQPEDVGRVLREKFGMSAEEIAASTRDHLKYGEAELQAALVAAGISPPEVQRVLEKR